MRLIPLVGEVVPCLGELCVRAVWLARRYSSSEEEQQIRQAEDGSGAQADEHGNREEDDERGQDPEYTEGTDDHRYARSLVNVLEHRDLRCECDLLDWTTVSHTERRSKVFSYELVARWWQALSQGKPGAW